ncbi:MAG TPA: FAD-dependent oxidoreductase [Microbacterium sp.]|uniref:FAD-dependent oxidoreductase n=1 Tax=Microbacterium sp. TaxID=51671 RepID=UPI002C5906DB|nr:FAD-dependent oxidoreductase [Microbacterium sp.]HWI32266.1 FAD-dependent oxidoreductase [Microbacterium sp.]
MTEPLRVLVVGYGPVGARFVEGVLPAVRSGRMQLTVVGAEAHDAYNRVLVAEYAVGGVERASLTIADRDEAEAAGARVLTGVSVRRLDREARSAMLSTGEHVDYDRVVLATGSRANTPTLDGVPRPKRDPAHVSSLPVELIDGDDVLPRGVTALRDLADAERVREAIRTGQRLVILGAGVLGLELALAAVHAGARVAVVHHGAHPMPRNLDRGGGGVLRQALRRTGLAVFAYSRAESVGFHTDDVSGERSFDRLITADGNQIEGDLLVLSCGVSPRAELAALAGLRTAFGVIVDRRLRSWSDPDVFAIGDCAHVVDQEPAHDSASSRPGDSTGPLPGGPSGLIGPGWRQADWLAARMQEELLVADGEAQAMRAEMDAEREPLVMLKAEHIDVVAVGDVSLEPGDDDRTGRDRKVSLWSDPEHYRYVKMVSENGVLTGFVCVGMPRTAAELTLLFERGGELPADRSLLLRFDGPDYVPGDDGDAFAPTATVCWCNAVTVERIEESAARGNDTVACIGRDTRAGTGCGGCKSRIADVLARHAAGVATPGADPVAAA